MLTPIVTRIEEIMDVYRLNIPQFAEQLGYKSPQKIYRLFNTAQASPSCQIIEDIGRAFDEVDLNWLILGEGNFYKKKTSSIDYKEKYYKCLEAKTSVYKSALQNQSEIYNLLKKINYNGNEES